MNRVCNQEQVHMKEQMSLVRFKVYVHLRCFQCYREKGFVTEGGVCV